MPRLSGAMEEGTIVRWLVADGAAVERGAQLVEIETDKATTTYDAESAGTLAIVAREGQTLPVGAVIGRLGSAVATVPAPTPGVSAVPDSPDGPVAEPVPQSPPPPAVAATPTSGSRGAVTSTEPTRTQALIARRMAESRATVPAFTLRATIDMDECVAMRDALKAAGAEIVPSINDLVVKAAAVALREHPTANGGYRDGRFEHYERVNVGVAVAAPGTLVVPTIFDADTKGLAEIATETRRLAGRVRSGEVTPPELSGGTFTVSNLGMFGVRSFEAVINPPQAAILAVGALESRAVVRERSVVIRRQMDVELSCDHRILYGADGAALLARIREILEAPLRLTL